MKKKSQRKNIEKEGEDVKREKRGMEGGGRRRNGKRKRVGK